MERCIENRYHRCVRHQFLAGSDSQNVWWVVQRRKGGAFVQYLQNRIIDHYRVGVMLTGMYDSVAYRIQLVHALQYTVLRVHDGTQNLGDRFLVCRHRCDILPLLVSADLRMCNYGTVHADSLHKALRQQLLTFHIQNLVLQGGASAVDYQYFHLKISFIISDTLVILSKSPGRVPADLTYFIIIFHYIFPFKRIPGGNRKRAEGTPSCPLLSFYAPR